jgi:hypothetical protein
MHKDLNHIVSLEMTRKEFLVYLSLAVLAITGISGMLQSLSSLGYKRQEKGFGSGPYGGKTQ